MLQNDNDIIRAMGYVALYASYLEEQIENLIELLSSVKKYEGGNRVSDKIEHAKKSLRQLNETEFFNLIQDLTTCNQLFKDRNKYMHRQIYAGINRPDTLRSTNPNIPDEPIYPSQLYQLANEFESFRIAIYSPTLSQIPEAITAALGGKHA